MDMETDAPSKEGGGGGGDIVSDVELRSLKINSPEDNKVAGGGGGDIIDESKSNNDENEHHHHQPVQQRSRSRSKSKLRAGYEEANNLFDDAKYGEAFNKFTLVWQGN
jgi:hypothetical protein